jgi:predicted nucleic acid-binding protein
VRVLIDANVVSELRKRERCNPGVAAWFARVSTDEVFFSVLTVGEIRKGVENIRRRDNTAAEVLEAWLDDLVTTYTDRLLSIDRSIAERWGHLNAPDPVPVIDGLLAATAIVHGLTLVTRNLKDIERTGVRCMNPFE